MSQKSRQLARPDIRANSQGILIKENPLKEIDECT
jgi:hypothetical protein